MTVIDSSILSLPLNYKSKQLKSSNQNHVVNTNSKIILVSFIKLKSERKSKCQKLLIKNGILSIDKKNPAIYFSNL
jgi:hypothetical protein